MPMVLAAVCFGLAGRTFGFEAVQGVVILAMVALVMAAVDGEGRSRSHAQSRGSEQAAK